MDYAQYDDYYVLRLDEGEEVISSLRQFLVEQSIEGGYFLAWGAFSRLKLSYYQPSLRSYKERTLDQQVEVASLVGNISHLNGEPTIHAHMVVGDENFQTYSGHLREGTVKPMLEVFVTPFSGTLHRVWDAQRNLAVLELEPVSEAAKMVEAR